MSSQALYQAPANSSHARFDFWMNVKANIPMSEMKAAELAEQDGY